jgi:hypothetical protein
MSIFLRLLLGHLVGDFVLQTIDLVRYKSSSWKGQLIHSGIVALCTAAFLWEHLPNWWPWLLLLFVLHLLTDWAKVSLDQRFPRWGLGLFFLDQILHFLAIFATIWLVEGGWSFPSWAAVLGGASFAANRNLLFLVAFLVMFFIVPILEIQVAVTVMEASSEKKRSKNGLPASLLDRLWGGGERTVALVLLYTGGIAPWFSPLVFLPRMLILCQRETSPLQRRLCWTKVVVSVVCAMIVMIALWWVQGRI